MNCKFEEIKGKILTEIIISENKDEIIFICKDNSKYRLFHDQECCENVTIEDICGDMENLKDTPILLAEKIVDNSKSFTVNEYEDEENSHTWTFYKLSTIKESVTIRWYGESTGYYSEEVCFEKILD